MTETKSSSAESKQGSGAGSAPVFINGVHGVRYQVTDVGRAIAFYTRHLGFKVGHQQLPAFATYRLATRRSS